MQQKDRRRVLRTRFTIENIEAIQLHGVIVNSLRRFVRGAHAIAGEQRRRRKSGCGQGQDYKSEQAADAEQGLSD